MVPNNNSMEVWGLVLVLAFTGVVISQDVVCGPGKTEHTVILKKGSSFTYRTQEGGEYGQDVKCMTTIKRRGNKATKCRNIRFSCTSFDVANKNAELCINGDKMVVDKQKYCQTTGPYVTSKKRGMKVNFVSDGKTKGAPGANCTIQCINKNKPAVSMDQGMECSAAEGGIFNFLVNFHTGGPMGEYQVEGCQGTSPTLMMERGRTYTFLQEDVTNWMHPLGFAYYPDGAHGYKKFAEVPELEYPTPEDCDLPEFSCDPGNEVAQAPLYGIDGRFETFEDWNNGITGGLDVYEPAFQVPQDQWSEHRYAVKLTIPEDSKSESLFYFCHIHKGMSGLIKVTDPMENHNTLVQEFDPNQYYERAQEIDVLCGTSGATKYDTQKDQFCPGMNFLCEKEHNPTFTRCMEAIDCKMNFEMRVEEHKNPMTVFMHQMIPHHENAVNMAKIALKHAGDVEKLSDDDLDIGALLRDIINTQNKQIQDMEAWLDRNMKNEPKLCPAPKPPMTASVMLG